MDLKEIKITYNTENRHPWEKARFAVISDQLKPFKNSDKLKILDYGCGDVYVAEELVLLNNKITIDAFDNSFDKEYFSSKAEQLKRNNKNIRLCNSIKVLKTDYDIVLLLDVLEHVENDYAILRQLIEKKIISDKTTVIVTVPAFQKLFSKRDYFLNHYRRYNKKSLNKLFKFSEFSVIKTQYFFTSLIIPRIIEKTIEKYSNKNVEGIGDYKSSIASYIVKQILIIDYRISCLLYKLKISIPGLSLLGIYKKKL